MKVTRGEVIYANDAAGVKIYTGRLEESGVMVAIKEQVHGSLTSANSAIRESLAMTQVSHHNIVKVYNCEIEENPPKGYKSVIALELMETDLNKRIEYRRRMSQWWSESELMSMFVQLIQALSYAQRMGISHRDIKPHNIFMSYDESVIKIGDFGSVCSAVVSGFGQRETLTGSPLYLSPKLKNYYIVSISQAKPSALDYNQYKSDVYSLGVTFLYMAMLDPPLALTELTTLENNTRLALERIAGYPCLKWFLQEMLVVDEDQRVDFVTLEQQLIQYGQIQSPDTYYTGYESYALPAAQSAPEIPQYAYYEESKAPVIPTYCYNCRTPFTAPFTPQGQYTPQQYEYAKLCCSEPCLQQILALRVVKPEEQQVCVRCGVGLGADTISMKCGHSFHNSDCVFDYLKYISDDFKIPYYDIRCPKCPENIENYGGFLIKAFKYRGKFEEKKDEIRKTYCVICHTKEDLVEWKCGHKFCNYHYERATFCGFCPRSRHSLRRYNK